jgi:hypothetical protein
MAESTWGSDASRQSWICALAVALAATGVLRRPGRATRPLRSHSSDRQAPVHEHEGGHMRVLLACLSLLAVLGCGDDVVAPELEALVGRWQAESEPLQPRGSLDRLFVVTADGRSENHTITRGLYAGQTADALSAEVVLYGRIRVRGNYFSIRPEAETTRDIFYGLSHRSVQRDFSGWPRDSTRFELRGDELFLEFYTYPADAPVLTQRLLSRAR